MQTELAQYEERMTSMCDAAFDDKQFDEVCQRLRERGLDVDRAEALRPNGSALPLAWILQATRGSQKEAE